MALTKRYVSVAGSGTNSGLDTSNEMTWAQMITDLNTPRAGYKYLVKSGNYANAGTTTTLTGDGTTTSPNVIEGYSTTEGDLLANGRDANGALVTTGFPVVSYTGTARFAANGATYLVIRNLDITCAASNATVILGTGSSIAQCKVTNTGTNAASSCVDASGGSNTVEDCDCETASTGAAFAIDVGGQEAMAYGNRIKCVPGQGIRMSTTRTLAIKNTIFECTTGIAVTVTTAIVQIIDNTIVNCTGEGIDIVTATTAQSRIKGNHITGCGGYGIDYNTSTCPKDLGHNRFRDNTSGNINGGGDWEEGTSISNVTSDDTDADDFTDQANDNYALKTTSPAITAGVGYRNPIGASGAGSFPAGGGGGPLIGGRLVK